MATRSRVSVTRNRAGKVTRAARNAVGGKLSMPRHEEQSDAALAERYDRVRGYDRPLREQSKDAHEMAETAPLVRWSAPSSRTQG
jgi:hypothetical protein